jgi:hypothetical protein
MCGQQAGLQVGIASGSTESASIDGRKKLDEVSLAMTRPAVEISYLLAKIPSSPPVSTIDIFMVTALNCTLKYMDFVRKHAHTEGAKAQRSDHVCTSPTGSHVASQLAHQTTKKLRRGQGAPVSTYNVLCLL